MHLKLKILVFIFLVKSYIGLGQEISLKVQNIVDELNRIEEIPHEYIFLDIVISEISPKLHLLDSIATKEELTKLIHQGSSLIKCAAFSSLYKKDIETAFSILKSNLHSTESIMTGIGCIGEHKKIVDVYLLIHFYNSSNIDSLALLSIKPKLEEIDSIIVTDPKIRLSYKSSIIRGLNPTEENYPTIKKVVQLKSDPFALVTLAKYQKEEDKKFIIDGLLDSKNEYYSIWAAREFPAKEFYPYLLKIFKKEWRCRYYDYPKWRILYQALACYPQEETLKLFEKTINAPNKFRREILSYYLLIAVKKYPHLVFEKYPSLIKLEGIRATVLEDEINAEK